jgi:SPX domain protein involved in polyphosphate accumulation
MQEGRYSEYRFERKFVSSQLNEHELEHIIRTHHAFFNEIYWERQVNNIYFDTHALQFFHDNVVGKSQRRKVRIRWYGEIEGIIDKPVLEFKIKSGLLGRKASFDLNPIDLNADLDFDYFQNLFLESGLPENIIEELKGLKPLLLNNYSRRYYRSADQHFRFTIDYKLVYFDFSKISFSIGMGTRDLQNTILELKYDQEHDEQAMEISQFLPIRLSKSSKYVNGIDIIRNNLAV